MRSNLRRQRLTAWLIIACIIGMLSSGLAHALVGSVNAVPWQEICSLNSVKQTGGDGRQDDAQAAHASHCAFCSKYDHAPALLSRIEVTTPLRWRAPAPAPAVLRWLPSATPHWTHRPRGPPPHVAIS